VSFFAFQTTAPSARSACRAAASCEAAAAPVSHQTGKYGALKRQSFRQ